MKLEKVVVGIVLGKKRIEKQELQGEVKVLLGSKEEVKK
jgi:hypothetical protein